MKKDINIFQKKFKLVSAIAMFYDLEDPINFIRNIKSILKTDGILHIEVAYLPELLGLFRMIHSVKNIMNIILSFHYLKFSKKQI